MSALSILFSTILLSLFIDSITIGVYLNSLYFGLALVLVNLFLNFMKNLFKKQISYHKDLLMEKIDHKISYHLMNVDYSYLEDPYYLDLKEQATYAQKNQGSVSTLLNVFVSVIENIIVLASLLGIILSFDIYLFLIAFAGIVISVILIMLSIKSELSFYKEIIPINRKFGYYLNTLGNEKYSKDFRIYDVGKALRAKLLKEEKKTMKYFYILGFKQGTINFLIQMVQYLTMGIVYIFVGIKTIAKGLSAALFSLYAQSTINFTVNFISLVNNLLKFYQVSTFITPFVELIKIKEIDTTSGKKELDVINKIEVKNLTFSYPRSETLILNDLSFTINRGEKIAIVGLNGAGKTTLIKLLCGLYKPTSGEILINDSPINEYNYDSYINNIGAVFQDFKLFAYSIKNNISPFSSIEEVNKVIEQLDLKKVIDNLPNGINSNYTKNLYEDGVELSGGEQQKIAIARALIKDASLVILDEPTSALDPLAEAAIYEHFSQLTKDKTSIFISHRMSSSVFCDKILVIDNGTIASFDTHSNLMKDKDSLYYQLFSTQAKNYQLSQSIKDED
jgi:ATP-binding cassette subfamily B protein/ATP-binding cassette subfamily C protein